MLLFAISTYPRSWGCRPKTKRSPLGRSVFHYPFLVFSLNLELWWYVLIFTPNSISIPIRLFHSRFAHPQLSRYRGRYSSGLSSFSFVFVGHFSFFRKRRTLLTDRSFVSCMFPVPYPLLRFSHSSFTEQDRKSLSVRRELNERQIKLLKVASLFFHLSLSVGS